jgi:hypothetical protein
MLGPEGDNFKDQGDLMTSNQMDAETARKICKMVGCSGMSPECMTAAQYCSIPRKFAKEYGEWLDTLNKEVDDGK